MHKHNFAALRRDSLVPGVGRRTRRQLSYCSRGRRRYSFCVLVVAALNTNLPADFAAGILRRVNVRVGGSVANRAEQFREIPGDEALIVRERLDVRRSNRACRRTSRALLASRFCVEGTRRSRCAVRSE